MRPNRLLIHRARRSGGLSLIVVLLILVVVSILGVGATQYALLGERSSRYDRDYQLAWQGADSALADGEAEIFGQGTGANTRPTMFTAAKAGEFVAGCGTTAANRGLCAATAAGSEPAWLTVDFTATGNDAPTAALGSYTGQTYQASTTGIAPARVPRYIIETVDGSQLQLPGSNAKLNEENTSTPLVYRVTASGFGPNVQTQVVLQALYRKE